MENYGYRRGMSENEKISKFFFTNTEGDSYLCLCGKTRKQQAKKGYQNLVEHVFTSHPNYKELMKTGNRQLTLQELSSFKSQSIFSWIELIVFEYLPFNFVEKERVRKILKIQPISENTLKKYVELLCEAVEQRITNILPQKFGISIDGWTEGSVHYYGLFAICPGLKPILLAFAPPLDETTYVAPNVVCFVLDCLHIFKKGKENLLFLVADSTAVNPKIARELKIGFVGCFSHRFNLVLEDYLKTFANPLEDIKKIMMALSTLKIAGQLRKLSNLKPKFYNSTRWSGKYFMLKRFFQLLPFLNQLGSEITSLMFSEETKEEMEVLLAKLEKLNSVTLALQREDLNLLQGFLLFENVMNDFPDIKPHFYPVNLPPNMPARAVMPSSFESAIITVLDEDEERLNEMERQFLKPFIQFHQASSVPVVENADSDYAAACLKRQKPESRQSRYMDLEFLCPTSNVVERLFSKAGLYSNDLRKALTPKNLETLVFLNINNEYWNLETMTIITNKMN